MKYDSDSNPIVRIGLGTHPAFGTLPDHISQVIPINHIREPRAAEETHDD